MLEYTDVDGVKWGAQFSVWTGMDHNTDREVKAHWEGGREGSLSGWRREGCGWGVG